MSCMSSLAASHSCITRTWRKLCHHAFCCQWSSHVVTTLIASIDLSRSCRACYKCIQLNWVMFTYSLFLSHWNTTVWHAVATLPLSELKHTWINMYNLRERVECTHLKFSVSGRSKQTNTYCVQRSHTSVALVQACLNNTCQKKNGIVDWRAGEKRSYQLY